MAQKQLQRNLEGLSKLAHCRSVQDFAAVQSGLIRESLQHMAEDSRTIAEISLRAVNDARKAIAGTARKGPGALERARRLRSRRQGRPLMPVPPVKHEMPGMA